MGNATWNKIYKEKNWKSKATKHYEKFLDLWQYADPGIAEVEDARKRLARLQESALDKLLLEV